MLFCTIFAFFAQNYASSRSSPTRIAFLMGSEPVFGALFAWLIFGETLSGWAWVGCGLILVATGARLDRTGTASSQPANIDDGDVDF